VEVTSWEPRPFVYLLYDGLLGISQRHVIQDVLRELQVQDAPTYERFLKALRTNRVHTADIGVYFNDYVNYGIGGGDVTSEMFLRTFLLVWDPGTMGLAERLWLAREDRVEEVFVET